MRPYHFFILLLVFALFVSCTTAVPPKLPEPPKSSPTPAKFSLSNLSIKPTSIQSGEMVSISIDATNTGGTDGNYTVVLMLNGEKAAEETIAVAKGNTSTVTFAIIKDDITIYDVAVGDLKASFTTMPLTGNASGIHAPGMVSFDNIISNLMKEWRIPGGAVAVAKNGRLVLARGYGMTDSQLKAHVMPTSLFRIASISNPSLPPLFSN